VSANPDPFEQLADALGGPTHPCVIALVGGGGKTTTMFGLTRLLQARGLRVVATTTTKMGVSQTGGLAVVGTSVAEVVAGIARHGAVVSVESVRGPGDRPKVGGPHESTIDELINSGQVDAIVIEADGSRRHNVKAPAHYEPVIPACATHVVALIGADALNEVIGDVAHRPDQLAAMLGALVTDRLTPERAAQLLMSESGSRKSVPANATFVVAITKVTAENTGLVNEVRARVHSFGFTTVVFPFDERIAANSHP
jgi:probable selenium-dependent hydroxylase accessory protein YqeC